MCGNAIFPTFPNIGNHVLDFGIFFPYNFSYIRKIFSDLLEKTKETFMYIDTRDEHQKRTRLMEVNEEKQKEAERLEEERKNYGFTQAYPRAWERIDEFIDKGIQSGRLYAFLARNLDPTCGAVVASQQFLAEQFGVTTRTIRNWCKDLEDRGALVRIVIAGKVCAYALDPYEVWKGYDSSKKYAAFNSKTLANYDGDIKRRLMAMFEDKRKSQKPEQQELEK
jgi:hypothetical protein